MSNRINEGVQIIGESVPVQNLVKMIQKVGPSRANVLITGESGTGKELVARALHYSSPSKGMPFVAINCGAIPENLLESELFGHKKGSFTGAISDKPGLFESADGGTLFLDEVGELPLAMQVKLLRAIQERIIRRVGGNEDIRIDVRILSATNRDLESQVKKGLFREDLFYRLNVIMIKTPPLRERGQDIERLAEWFLLKNAERQKKDIKGFSAEALRQIRSYPWPGNVRELENVIERAVTLESTPQVTLDSLPVVMQGQLAPQSNPAGSDSSLASNVSSPRSGQSVPGSLVSQIDLPEVSGSKLPCTLDEVLERVERYYIEAALKKTDGRKKAAASFLGITFRSFRYRIIKYGFSSADDGADSEN